MHSQPAYGRMRQSAPRCRSLVHATGSGFESGGMRLERVLRARSAVHDRRYDDSVMIIDQTIDRICRELESTHQGGR